MKSHMASGFLSQDFHFKFCRVFPV